MQAYQRKRHRVMWVVIAVTGAVLMVMAWLGRKEIPRMEELPVPNPVEEKG